MTPLDCCRQLLAEISADSRRHAAAGSHAGAARAVARRGARRRSPAILAARPRDRAGIWPCGSAWNGPMTRTATSPPTVHRSPPGPSDSSPTATSWRSPAWRWRSARRAICTFSSALPAPSSPGRRAGASPPSSASGPTSIGGRRTWRGRSPRAWRPSSPSDTGCVRSSPATAPASADMSWATRPSIATIASSARPTSPASPASTATRPTRRSAARPSASTPLSWRC